MRGYLSFLADPTFRLNKGGWEEPLNIRSRLSGMRLIDGCAVAWRKRIAFQIAFAVATLRPVYAKSPGFTRGYSY